jgi:hypothetical protein
MGELAPAEAARAARDAFRTRVDAPGHAVDNIRLAATDLGRAVDSGGIRPTPEIEQMLADLHVALEQDDGQNLGGKSAEAARFIARALLRELDRQVAEADAVHGSTAREPRMLPHE